MREATKIRDATVFLMGSNSISDGEQQYFRTSTLQCLLHLPSLHHSHTPKASITHRSTNIVKASHNSHRSNRYSTKRLLR
jgi:hypothetical protein